MDCLPFFCLATMRDCKRKRKFNTYSEANSYAMRRNNKVLVYHLLRPYWCHRHKCFHIGHSRIRATYSIQGRSNGDSIL